jgi:hypothetical protein
MIPQPCQPSIKIILALKQKEVATVQSLDDDETGTGHDEKVTMDVESPAH